MNVEELATNLDPFNNEDGILGESEDVGSNDNNLHIRIQQRNGKKTLTTLAGLPKEYDIKKVLKAFKKDFACNGHVVSDTKAGEVIQLQGDQRNKIASFLKDNGIPPNIIKVHGF